MRIVTGAKRQQASKDSSSTMGVLEMETEAFLDEPQESSAAAAANSVKAKSNQLKGVTLILLLATFAVGYLLQESETVIEDTALADQDQKKAVYHVPGFGGVNNVAQPGGAKAAAKGEGIAFADIVVPKSNVGHAIPSLNPANVRNLWGHYVHDEHRSPYASHFYDATEEELDKRQKAFEEKMKKVREEWGAWDFKDPSGASERNLPDFDSVDYKDLPLEDFPPSAWQTDEEYVASFLQEAKALVKRVKEGIYAEYGWPHKEGDAEYLQKRDKFWKIHVWDPSDCESNEGGVTIQIQCAKTAKDGIATLQKVAFDGLVRKLLHALMTNDEFYALLGGHSAAAGHGNDFQQNRIITFHHLMEPVFQRLGVRLVSRNMGMGGVGTLQFSLAGGDLYGETDIVEWDSGMTEKGSAVDLFNKQAILSGERVPVIMNEYHFDIMNESNGTAWMGMYVAGNEKNLFPDTTYDNFMNQPFAARWFNEKNEKYNAVCWEPRSNFTPEKKQKDHPGSQVGWHPGNRRHQWSGRKLALILLEALQAAFAQWEEGVAAEGVPLATKYWHVGDSYKQIRQTLRTHINTPNSEDEGDDDIRSACEKLIPYLPRLCRVQMHGFGMWWPRAHESYDLLNIIHEAPNGYKPDFLTSNAYDGVDVMPLNQAIPDGEIDVHAIAIATTTPPPADLDHSMASDDKREDASDRRPTRRELRLASERAFRRAAELDRASTVVENKDGEPNDATISSSSSTIRTPTRRLENTTATESSGGEQIVPGRGWEVHGWTPVKGFCDGSPQSECSRNTDSDCMILGANDKHLDVWGSSRSGWLVFTVPKVREGIILVRMEWWCGRGLGTDISKGWTEVNNGMTTDTTPWNATAHRLLMAQNQTQQQEEQRQRKLKKPTLDMLVPKDFEMDWAINGVIKTMKRDEWVTHTREYVKNVAVWPLLDDPSMAQRDWDGEPVEVAIRFRSERMPQQTYCVSHVYYA